MGKTIRVQLTLDIDGATVDEIVKGLAAAQAIFVDARTAAYDTAAGSIREGYQQFLGKISTDWLTNEEDLICAVWDEAEKAAIEACCAGWTHKPTSGRLQLVEFPREKHRRQAA